MGKTITKLLLTLVLFANAADQPCDLEKEFTLASRSVDEHTKAHLVTNGAIRKIGPHTQFPEGETQGVVVKDTKLPGDHTHLDLAFHFDSGVSTRIGLGELVKSLYNNRETIHRHKFICEFLQEIWEHYVEHKSNTTREKNYYVKIDCKDGNVLGQIVPSQENAYGALFKESGEWYFDDFSKELDPLELNKCLRSLITQLELYGTCKPIISSKLHRKSVSELLQEPLMSFNYPFKFISVIQGFSFSTLKCPEHYNPRPGFSISIVVFTEIQPKFMKRGEVYKMTYDFISNETNPDLQAHLDLVKAHCGKEEYRIEFLERVKQLVSKSKKSYFKVDRAGPKATIVECPTIDAHGSCVIKNKEMEVNWFYNRPDDKDDLVKALISYYNEGKTNFEQPTILESWPEETSSKRRKLN